MGFKSTFDMTSVERSLRARLEKAKLAMVNTLAYVGETCVNTARSLPHPPAELWKDPDGTVKSPVPPHQPNYIDWSSNLRSSIGYVVVMDGKIMQMSSFEAVNGGEEGSQRGKAFAEEIAGRYSTGIALILVAGMHYAAYVSSKGYDVLNSAAIQAEELAPRLIKQLKEQW